MRTSTKTFVVVSAVGIMAVSVFGAPVIKDITVKFNPNMRFTLNGEEVLEEKGALVYNDRVYVPVRDFSELLGMEVDYDESGIVVLKQTENEEVEENTENTENTAFVEKSTDIKFNGSDYEFRVSLPSVVADYATLKTDENENNTYCMIYFEKDNNTAIIGTYTFFKAEDYDAMDPAQTPVPTEVYRLNDVVVGFNGLYDMPFDESTGLVPVIEEYHKNIGAMNETVVLSVK